MIFEFVFIHHVSLVVNLFLTNHSMLYINSLRTYMHGTYVVYMFPYIIIILVTILQTIKFKTTCEK